MTTSGRGVRAGAERLPASLWVALLADADTRRRYEAKVYRRSGDRCWPWLGTISSTGHGKLRAGTRTGGVDPDTGRARAPTHVVSAHVYGWQLVNGVIEASPGADLVVAHLCDEAWCQRPEHWHLVDRASNTAEYHARRHRVGGHPLADGRGARGRAVAIREAVRDALAGGAAAATVDAAIWSAATAGIADAGQDTLW